MIDDANIAPCFWPPSFITILGAIAHIESHVFQFDLNNLSQPIRLTRIFDAQHLQRLGELLYTNLSKLENHVRDHTRWHRELLDKMFLDIKSLRPAVFQKRSAQCLEILLGFRHKFRHAYEFKLDKTKTVALWSRWSLDNVSVKQALNLLANQLKSPNQTVIRSKQSKRPVVRVGSFLHRHSMPTRYSRSVASRAC